MPKQTPQPKAVRTSNLTCAVCLSRMKEPKLLPCLHSYCKACLEGILHRSKTKTITCPQCRSEQAVPQKGVGEFPTDFVLENALDFEAIKESKTKTATIPCGVCAEDDPATVHCPTCGKFLCEFCSTAHKRMIEYRDHKMVPLDKLDSGSMKSFTRLRYCTKHSGEVLKLFCKTCKKLICRDCTIVDHRSHDFGFVTEVRPEIQNSLESALKGVKEKKKELEKHLTFVNELASGHDMYYTGLKAEINAAYDSFIKTLETRRKQLLAQQQGTQTATLKQIWAQKEFLEMSIATAESSIRYCSQLSACSNDTDALAMSSTASHQLESLQKVDWKPTSHLDLPVPLVFKETKAEGLKETGSLNGMTATNSQIQIQVKEEAVSKKVGESQRLTISMVSKSGRPLVVLVPKITIKPYYYNSTVTHTLEYTGNGTWLVQFTPQSEGTHTVTVAVDKSTISTYQVHVTCMYYY